MKDLSAFNLRQSPIQKLTIPLFDKLGIELFLKRDDLLHPFISGNKWRKLKYNLFELEQSGKVGIITFGGAFSNHLHAVAAAGSEFDFKTIGIVRGEEPQKLSSTLEHCLKMGMQLIYVSREDYRLKEKANTIQEMIKRNPDYVLIPEGGANQLALKGCAEIVNEIDFEFDYLCTASGTGTTLAGILSSANHHFQTIGFPVLKGGEFIADEVRMLNPNLTQTFELKTDYHFGGYAKYSPELLHFIRDFETQTDVQLEQVYTGKMMYGIVDLAKKGYFKQGSKIVALHTGGLQGRLPAI